MFDISGNLCQAKVQTHVKSETVFLVGKLWLRGNLWKFFFYDRAVGFNNLNLVSSITSLATPSWSCERIMQISLPSFHCTESFISVAEGTALASPAPVHRGRTPYDLAKEFGHQKVMGLLHPVPRWKAVEE